MRVRRMRSALQREGASVGAVAAALVTAIAVTYAPIASNDFVDWDDDLYVYQNGSVLAGLTGEGIAWAFTTLDVANWHPLTWLSHMLDAELFGTDPRGHHAVSVALHALNAVLLLTWLWRATASLWPAAAVAVLFALHPLHVESVAWVSERKDLLCALFGLLALHAYLGYARRRSAARYALVVAAFAAGLAAKSMLVTLPGVLLLVDHWPLGRTRSEPLARLALEKLPLLALSLVAAWVALRAQGAGHSVASLEVLGPWQRLAGSILAYTGYLTKTLWPSGLACLYPHPALIAPQGLAARASLAAAALVAISAGVALASRRRPWLGVGWLWYLGMLVPVIGVVQVGVQGMADRYTYLPLIGIYTLLAWSVWEAVRGKRRARLVASGMLVAVACACSALSAVQVTTWRDSRTLFEHALGVAGRHYVLLNNLGNVEYAEGNRSRALELYAEAARLAPGYAKAHYNLGNVVLESGQPAESLPHFLAALRADPDYASAHNNLGNALFRLRRTAEAADRYQRALALDPTLVQAHNNLGSALYRLGRLEEAVAHYQAALGLDPDWAEPRVNLAMTLEQLGRYDAAVAELERARALRPDDARIRARLERARARAPRRPR